MNNSRPTLPRVVALRVAPSVEAQLRRGHPWVYDGAVRQVRGDGRPGDFAAVYDARNRFVALGLYDPTSPIRVRVLQAGTPATIDQEWFAQRLRAAIPHDQCLTGCATVPPISSARHRPVRVESAASRSAWSPLRLRCGSG